jgi:BarA-like signal transduction histidine kinase
MKRLLLATAMTVTLLVPAKADVNYDTIKRNGLHGCILA